MYICYYGSFHVIPPFPIRFCTSITTRFTTNTNSRRSRAVCLRRDLAVLVCVGQFKDLPKLFASRRRIFDGELEILELGMYES